MQKNGNMNEFEVLSLRREIMQFSLSDAKSVMERGLKYFVGDNYKWLPEYDKVVEWLADNKRRGLMLFGSNGRGKTIIVEKILPVIFQYYLKDKPFFADARALKEYDKNLLDRYELWCSVNPIIIDDVGVECIANDYGEKRDLFSEIVDQCEKEKRLLIFSTNLTPKNINERYGLRTLDRLKAIVRAIKFQGDSLRTWSYRENNEVPGLRIYGL